LPKQGWRLKKKAMAIERLPAMRRFIEAYRHNGNVRLAAEAAGLKRRTVYLWLEASRENPDDPDYHVEPGVPFEKAALDAREEAADRLEETAWKFAVEGVEQPVVGTVTRMEIGPDGKPREHRETGVVGTRREYPFRLIEFLLKGARPDRYRDSHKVAVAVQTNLQINDSSRDRLAQKLLDVIDRREKAALGAPAVVDAVPAKAENNS
jgi:hypothetical protein